MLIKRYLIPLILIAKQRLFFFFPDKKLKPPASVYNLFSLSLAARLMKTSPSYVGTVGGMSPLSVQDVVSVSLSIPSRIRRLTMWLSEKQKERIIR